MSKARVSPFENDLKQNLASCRTRHDAKTPPSKTMWHWPVSLAFSLCPSKLRLGGLGLQRGNLFFLPPFFRDRAGVLRGLRRLPRQLHHQAAGRLAALQPLRVRQQFLGLRKCLW